MARDPRSVNQFRALRWLDRFFSTDDRAELVRRYDAALARLDDGGFDLTGATVARVEEIVDRKDGDGAPAPLEHLSEHWLSGQYWPSISRDVISERLQKGYRAAIADAREAGLPLCSVWVCATEDSKADIFKVDHVVGPAAVIVAIVTPLPSSL